MAEPQTGNHVHLFEIEDTVDEIVSQLCTADMAVDGLFCDLVAGFDGKELRRTPIYYDIIPNVCPNPRNGGENTEEWLYDEEMYKHRWKIERTNAWMDGFKAVLTRFETTVSNWKGWNFLAFIVIFLKNFHKSN